MAKEKTGECTMSSLCLLETDISPSLAQCTVGQQSVRLDQAQQRHQNCRNDLMCASVTVLDHSNVTELAGNMLQMAQLC